MTTVTLFDYEAEKDEFLPERNAEGSKVYRRPWNTCDPETPADHFYQHVVETLRESDSKAMFEYAWHKADGEDPAGLLIRDRSAETSKYIDSRMYGVKRTLEDAGFAVQHVTDKRYRNNKKPTQLLVTGHAMCGGELPLQVESELELL